MRVLVPLLLVLAAVSGACSPAAASLYERVSAATLAPDDALPVPDGAPDLTITGAIGRTNQGNALALDLATIEQLGLVRYTVRDPWLEQELEFTGVLMSDLLVAAGAAPTATSIHLVALDDYEVDIPLADLERWPIMLATRTDGLPMSVEDKGPTRIVFPPDPSIDTIRTKDFWIWQLKSIRVG